MREGTRWLGAFEALTYIASMARSAADIVNDATQLMATERAKVVTQLLKTLDPPGDQVDDFRHAWADELDRRERELELGDTRLVDWNTLRASLKR